MLTRIIRHEWRSLTADATLAIVAAVFAGAVAYGVWTGTQWVSFQSTAIATATTEQSNRYRQLAGQLAQLASPGAAVSAFADPRDPANFGSRLGPRYAILPPAPLAALSVGQSDLLPYYFKVTTDARENLVSASEIENPSRLQAGRFDLSFVVIFLLPLLILAVSYNMLSAEREQGTLALALSQPLSAGRLVLGKVALRVLLLGAVVAAVSVIAVLGGGVNLAGPNALVQLLFWAIAVACYGAFWFALAVAVTSLGWPSTTNAAALAAAWLVLTVMLPALFNLAATTLFPVPSRVEMIQATREASDAASQQGSVALARYYEDHPELASGDAAQAMADASKIRVAIANDVEARVRPVVQRYESQIAAQQRLVDRLRFLSPAILMQNVLNDVSGTGTDRHQWFLSQVTAYHAQWREYFVRKIFARSKVTDLGEVPAFVFAEEPLAMVAGRIGVNVVALFVIAGGIGGAGWWRLRRYAVVA